MSEVQPLVSIGLPVHNGEPHIALALDSLLFQDYKNFELIISDNGSDDRTREICLEYSAKDPRIRYYRNPTNVGAVKNFNRVFELSSGEYFMWAGHHDVWKPSFISECLAQLAENRSAVLCFCPIALMDNEGACVGKYDENLNTLHLDLLGRFHLVLWRLRWKFGAGASIYGLIRSEALRRTRLAENVYGSDWVLLAELSLLGSFVTVPEPLFSLRAAHAPTRTIKDQIDSLDPANSEKIVRHPFRDLTLALVKRVATSRIQWWLKPLLIVDAVYSMQRKLDLWSEFLAASRSRFWIQRVTPAQAEEE